MKYFTIKFLLFYTVLLGLVLYVTYYIKPNSTGDIGRLGMIPFGISAVDTMSLDNDARVFTTANLPSNVQVLTLGDSFSQQGKRGYQQFIGKKLDSDVINYPVSAHHFPEQIFINLLYKNQLDSNSIIIIESVERGLMYRLLNMKFTPINNQTHPKTTTATVNNETKKFINIPKLHGLKELSRWIRLVVRYQNPTIKFELKQSCFSNVKYDDRLYIYDSPWDQDGDMRFQGVTDQIKTIALNNLLSLKQLADDHNIRLIYLVAANKYDVYSPWIINNTYPLDDTMQVFAGLDSTWFVDTKRVLQRHVKAGVKDVYYVNDTHWSPVGAKIVGEYIATMIANDLDSLGIVH